MNNPEYSAGDNWASRPICCFQNISGVMCFGNSLFVIQKHPAHALAVKESP